MQEFSLHNHSTFSDGKHSISELIYIAQKHGLKAIGISDHFYNLEKNLYEYVNTIKELKKHSDITIYMGAEVDLNGQKDDMAKIKKQFGFDYYIGSLHFFHFKHNLLDVQEQNDKTQSIGFHKKYWYLMNEILDSEIYDIIGHMDHVKRSGIDHSNLFIKEIELLLSKSVQNNKVIEINTKWDSVPDGIIQIGIDKKVKFILSSDAHDKSKIVNQFDSRELQLNRKFTKIQLIKTVTDLKLWLQTRHAIQNLL